MKIKVAKLILLIVGLIAIGIIYVLPVVLSRWGIVVLVYGITIVPGLLAWAIVTLNNIPAEETKSK